MPYIVNNIKYVGEGPGWNGEWVTMRQARLALLYAGHLANVEAALAAFPGVEGAAARIEWEYSSQVFRHKTLVVSLGAALGLTEEDLDALFLFASTIDEGAV